MISKNQIKHIRSLEHKKFRDQYGVFVAEGPKVVNDLKGHFELVELFEGEDKDLRTESVHYLPRTDYHAGFRSGCPYVCQG